MNTWFTPDPNRVAGLTDNTDRDTLTEWTQELFRERSEVERIIEYYGLLASNVNNEKARDRMSVGKYDIYSREEDPNERQLIVAKGDQRAILERYCRSIGLWIIDKTDIGLKIIPNPPDKKVPKKATNLLWLPVDQFKDPNVWHATTGGATSNEWTSKASVTEADSRANWTVDWSQAQGAWATEGNEKLGSTMWTWSNEGQNKVPKTDAWLPKNDSTAGNDWSKWGGKPAGTVEVVDPKVKNARDNYRWAVWSEVPQNKKNDIARMTTKTNEALGL